MNFFKSVLSILSFSLVILIFGCEPPVTFTEPQPINKRNLAEFPKRLRGQYLSLSDSSKITIDDKLIKRIYDIKYQFHPNQIDSTFQISGDTLINLETKEKTILNRSGDSLINNFHSEDTIFEINNKNVLRKFKGYYFLNISYSSNSWEVKKVQSLKSQLIISSISAEEDIDNLKSITESINDTVLPYKFKATNKQFEEFLKNEGFKESEVFVRIN